MSAQPECLNTPAGLAKPAEYSREKRHEEDNTSWRRKSYA
jgi:hypothetical protein